MVITNAKHSRQMIDKFHLESIFEYKQYEMVNNNMNNSKSLTTKEKKKQILLFYSKFNTNSIVLLNNINTNQADISTS